MSVAVLRQAWRHPLAWLYGVLAILPFLITPFRTTVSLITEILCFALMGLGFNLLLGYTGLVSFGHGAYFGLAAYAGSLVQIHLTGGFLIPVLAGTAMALATGAAIGFLVMRKRGVYFSLLTLAFTQMFFYIVYRWTRVTGGENGLGGVSRPPIRVPGLGSLNLENALTYYYVVLAVLAAMAFLAWRIVHSPFGRVLQAIRENEPRAAFVGYNTRAYKFAAFVLSAAYTGLAGILYALLIRFVYPQMVAVDFSGEILAMTVVGGMRHFLGPVVGAAFFAFFRDFLSAYTENWLIVFGGLFMAFILVSPEGILGVAERVATWMGLGEREGADAVPRGPERRPDAPRPDRAADPAPAHPAGEDLLVCGGVTKRFGALVAVDGVNLAVRRGELRSIIGPNGAGKTTLFNCLTSFLEADGGAVAFAGRDVTGLPPYRLVRQGIGRSFQIISVFQALTVFENVRVAVQAQDPGRGSLFAWADHLEAINARTWEILDRMGLGDRAGVPAGTLSHGDQRLLEIGIVLATRPALLLLDEPLAGLSATERTRVADLIRRLAGPVTVILIEHDIDRVLALSDRITVMHQGRVIAEGTPAEVQRNPEVQAAYLGGSPAARVPARPPVATAGEPILAVRGINAFYGKSHVLHDVSLEVAEGEVLALLGRNGAGKTTTLSSIVGTVPPRWGQVRFRGHEIARRPPEQIARLGVSLVPQGRRIFPNLTVKENLLLASWLAPQAREAEPGGADGPWTLDRVYALMPKLGELHTSKGDQLSGGERQMLAIGRALMSNASLLLLDEPFEGLAPAIIDGLVGALEQLRGTTTLLLVEQNADLALALADRVYVLNNGTVTYSGSAAALRGDYDLRVSLLGV